jgi:hypothetical protein
MKNKRAKVSIWIALILVLCFGAASSANAATLTIISLKCFEPEDRDWDEALLKVTGEGGNHHYKQKMKRGKVWRLNQQIVFANELRVRLYDLDDPDGDDYLGGITIGSEPTDEDQIVTLNRDGAHYELKYRVDP